MMNTSPSNPPVGLTFVYLLNAVSAALLLLLLPLETQSAPPNQGWWTQPALMPSLALSMMLLSASYLAVKQWRLSHTSIDSSSFWAEVVQWLRPLEFFVYYRLYIWLLGSIGYFLSSLLFILVLCLRVGLRSRTWLLTAFLSAVALVALFRWGLKVWVPVADLYDLFPRELRIFLMRYF